MTVAAASRVINFTVVSSQDTFGLPSTFGVYYNGTDETAPDLLVYIDGVLEADWSFSGTYTNGKADGGNVVLDTPITSGTVVIWSVLPGTRVTDFPASVQPAVLNIQIDRLTAVVQDLRNELKRCFKIPRAEVDSDATMVDQEVPGLSTRASNAAVFDANGRLGV